MREDPRSPTPTSYGDYGAESRDAPQAAQDGYRAVAPGAGRYLRDDGGRPPGLSNTATRPSTISGAMESLNAALVAPVQALAELEGRLQPVLRPSFDDAAGDGSGQVNPRPILPPLAERLQDFVSQLDGLCARIELLIYRVEL